jgi:hypothetical protein
MCASDWFLIEQEVRALPYEMARAPLHPIVARPSARRSTSVLTCRCAGGSCSTPIW